MEFVLMEIPDIIIIVPTVLQDNRGFFLESFQACKFAQAGLPVNFVQDNHSGSHFGTLRGLHYQIKNAQGKLIQVVVGEVFEVVVDIRQSSPYFGKWVGVHLSATDRKQIWVPPGFANGFLVLSNWAEIIYKATDFYAPTWERTIFWNDPQIDINWPMLDKVTPILSEKDMQGNFLKDAEVFE